MFSAKKSIAFYLALAGPGIAFAQSDLGGSSAEATEQPTEPVAEVFLEQQLDWRSYYLNRIDGSRTEGRTDRVPRFHLGA